MRRLFVLHFVAATLCLDVGRVEALQECRLRVGWEPYAPYTFDDGAGGVTGADIDIIEAIAEKIDCRLEFLELPWARILREVEAGTLDVSTSTSWTEDRTAWALFSRPYRETEMAIYVRRGEVSRYTLEQLADVPRQSFRLGVIVDYYYGKELDELSRDPEFTAWIDGAPDYQTNIRKLVIGRIDGYLAEDVVVMESELARLGLRDQVERYPLVIVGEALRFMFSRKTVTASTVAEVDAAIEQLRESGALSEMIDHYRP